MSKLHEKRTWIFNGILKFIPLCLSPNYTFKVCLQRECENNNEVENRFMKCWGNKSYLSELFLAGNCNFHCKTHSEIAEPCCMWVVKCVQPRFPMLTINRILGPHSVQSENNTMVTDACASSDRKKSWGKKRKRELLWHIYLSSPNVGGLFKQ